MNVSLLSPNSTPQFVWSRNFEEPKVLKNLIRLDNFGLEMCEFFRKEFFFVLQSNQILTIFFQNGASWSSCSCISNTTSVLLSSSLLDAVKGDSDSEDVHSGYCSLDCGYNTYILMITIFITTVSSFAAGIPSQQVRNSHFVVNQPNFLDYVESCAI